MYNVAVLVVGNISRTTSGSGPALQALRRQQNGMFSIDTARFRIRPELAFLACLMAIISACGPRTPEASLATASPGTPGLPANGTAITNLPARPLAIWWPDALLPDSPDAPFAASIAAIAADRPIEFSIKPAYGVSGIQAFLASTAQASPDRLPDLALLPLGALRDAHRAGLIQDIPESAGINDDCFDFASARAGEGDTVWALPVAVDLLHGIGRDVDLPASWQALQALGRRPLILPLGGTSPPDLAAMVASYAAEGGDPSTLPDVDPVAFEAMVGRLSDALKAGNLGLPLSGNSPHSAWNTFAAGDPPFAAVNAATALANQGHYPGLTWASLPGGKDAAPPIAWGWALVLPVRDPDRLVLAAQLALDLAAALREGSIRIDGQLPTVQEGWRDRASAGLDPLPDAAYLDFLEEELASAIVADSVQIWGPGWALVGADIAAGRPASEAAARRLQP
jgi:hypothetical protein